MEIIDSIDEMQNYALSVKRQGKKVGFVPTMGCLHDGHISLIHLIRDQADIVILSIFVNPKQFGENEDFEKYPKRMDQDIAHCRENDVDILFIPSSEEIYVKQFSTTVSEDLFSNGLCGKSRPDHFNGVTTICSKLFNICQPDYLVLGQKDAQQVSVLRKIIKDLNFPIEVKVGPIIREDDGLAMSSRNTYLSESERKDARILSQSIELAKKLVSSGMNDVSEILNEVSSMIKAIETTKVDYLEIVNFTTMKKEKVVVSNQSILLIAVWVNNVRLIDNQIL